VTPTLSRRSFAEFLGTGLLVAIVVGSGIAAQSLSTDAGVQLLENAVVTAAGLAVLILMLGPVSGGHFNPVVSAVDMVLGRRSRRGLSPVELAMYIGAQMSGAVGGAVLADAMYDRPLVAWSQHHRDDAHLLLGEVVATAGLVLLVVSLARTQRSSSAPWAVGAYIGAAYWFTSSTSFANPAVSVGRSFTDTFAGIAPHSLPGFIGAQLVGAVIGIGAVIALFPVGRATTGDVVVPTEEGPTS
jgi:glycerol uptake facilitator-like aquaporin